jgi:hypothetical protein
MYVNVTAEKHNLALWHVRRVNVVGQWLIYYTLQKNNACFVRFLTINVHNSLTEIQSYDRDEFIR